ncbi:MAG TPA: class I SAM-dependent methyltransferase [Candidatus Ozemobacteraceae bacterium]|nr:class I SAM-dependent methyltransferase [Candidatus Ozemobacteraceae bacterium]
MKHALSFPTIDWEAIYNHPWHTNDTTPAEKNQVAFWDGRSGDFARKAHHPDQRRLAEHLLAKFSWHPHERVLDVGAGPGTFAIPLAQRVAHVTAFDLSLSMLEELRRQAVQEGKTNIDILQGRWLSDELKNRTGYDTVICFNALGVAALDEDGTCHMGKAVDRLREAARRGMVLVPHADLPADPPMRAALNLPETGFRRERIAILYHIMIRHGLLPNLEILPRPFFWTFRSLEEGVQVLGQRLEITNDPERMARLADHLSKRLEPDGDSFLLQYPVSQALFTWKREES